MSVGHVVLTLSVALAKRAHKELLRMWRNLLRPRLTLAPRRASCLLVILPGASLYLAAMATRLRGVTW